MKENKLKPILFKVDEKELEILTELCEVNARKRNRELNIALGFINDWILLSQSSPYINDVSFPTNEQLLLLKSMIQTFQIRFKRKRTKLTAK